MTSSRRNAAAVAAIAALLVVSACSKAETPSTSTPPSPGTAASAPRGSTASASGTTLAPGPTYGAADTSISAATNETFTIKLESNPSTGYRWTYTAQGESVKLAEETSDNPGGIGAPGSQLFTFQAISPGATMLVFTYARSTPAPDDKTVTYDVAVTG
ncbi:MAG: protease inhibitor I42 family protein [Actinobacteria bacterium]|nr:protease inhibitor I42 family protein [Actinomycetota bacterium]